jgi:hypothetical protein
MPNLKFSQFQEQTDPANVQFVVGYNGTNNVRITPGNLGGYPFLIDTQSLYSGFVPSGLSGNPQGNTVLGISASSSATTGFNNTALGYGALSGNTTGSYNTAVGNNALSAASTTSYNTAIGHSAGRLTTGTLNTFLGEQAGEAVTVGQDNVFLGAVAGYQNTSTTSNTILIGYNTNTSPAGASNFIVLGNANHTTLQIPGIQSGASNGDVLTYNSTFGRLELQTPSSGGPAGSDTQLQYNNGGAFGAIPGFTYNDTNDRLIIDTTRVVFGDASGTSFQNGLTIWDDVEFRGNKFELSDGSATNPILTFFNTGDNNTGMFRPGSDIIAFATGGQEEFRIGANGEIGLSGANFGTAGQVLTSNGTGSGASWTTASGGATDLNGLSDCLVDTLSLYVGEVPSGLSGNPQGNLIVGVDAGNALTSGANNTLLGNNAGKALTTAASNVIIGKNAGLAKTSGSNATIIGTSAGRDTASGSYVVLVGSEAGISNTGDNAIAIGSEAGRVNTATSTISIGYQAGYSQTSGASNINLGYEAGYSNTTGAFRTMIGYQAGKSQTGGANTFIGSLAGGSRSGSGTQNVAIGNNALRYLENADNTAIGSAAGQYADSTSSKNVMIGSQAMAGAFGSKSNNVAVGYKSGFAATTGGDNTLIGYQAGLNVTTSASNTVLGSNALGYHNGNNNVAIGGNAMVGSASFTGTGTDNVAIGYNAGGAGATAYSNSILIGKDAATSPAGISNVIAIGNSSQTVLQMPGITSGASNGDVLMYDTANFPFNNLKLYPSGTTPSDARDKKDIEDLPYGLAFINSLQPRKYVWDNRVKTIERESFDEDGNPITITEEFVANEKGTIGFGFIAQELQEVDNEVLQLVNDSNEDSLRINYSKLVPVLVKAIQELKAEIELLKQ